MRAAVLRSLALLCLAVLARADTLETLEGPVFTGKLSLATDTFVVSREGAEPVRIPVASLRRLIFERASAAPPPVVTNQWRGQAVGTVPITGGFTVSNDVLHVTSSGSGKRMADGHYFVWDALGSQAELTALVPPQTVTKKEAEKYKSAGLELRAQLDGAGGRYSLFVESGRSVVAQSRTADGKERTKHFTKTPRDGCWLRLTRNQVEITAALSTDGEVWKVLDTQFFALPDSAFAGLLVCGAKRDGECTVPFQQVKFRSAAGVAPGLPQLVLRDGSGLAGKFLGTDGSVVRWAALGREWSVSLVNVSRLVLQPHAQTLMSRVRSGRVGGLLASGDFVDGELAASNPGQVRISSVLFGLRSYAAAGDVVAVYVREVAEAPLEYEARMNDGSRLHLRQLTSRDGTLTARERSLGEVTLPLAELAELRRSGGK